MAVMAERGPEGKNEVVQIPGWLTWLDATSVSELPPGSIAQLPLAGRAAASCIGLSVKTEGLHQFVRQRQQRLAADG